MKHLLEMNHFLPTLKTGNAKKSNVKLDTYEIPENIKEFFSRNGRNLSMISEIHEDGSIDVNGYIVIDSDDLIDGKISIKFGYVSGDFNCSDDELTSLEGCPQEVGGRFSCNHNQLTSLEGCPMEVGGDFCCSDNKLTSLKGCPWNVGGSFYCDDNKLISLECCPQSVGGHFNCSNNQLISLKFCPQEVEGNFRCEDNPGNFTKYYVGQYCNVKGKIEV